MPQLDENGNPVTGGSGSSGSSSGSDSRPTIAVTRKILSSSLDGKHYSSASQTQQWIVIHNTGGGTASSAYNWFNNPSNPYQTSAHYCVDDKEIIQCLEDNWKGHHAGGSGVKYQDQWRPSNSEDCTNSNSIGIEVADWGGDYTGEQFGKAIENAIDLTISLMKTHNIDVNHVIRHGDTQNKDCPMYIMKENKWGYFKEQLANRTGGSLVTNNGSGSSGGSSGSGGGSGGSSTSGNTIKHNAIINADGGTITTQGTNDVTQGKYSAAYGYLTYYYGINFPLDVVPNQDHRYNIANMEDVKGACLIFLPPYNVCNISDKEEWFKIWNWDKQYHYVIDPSYDADNDANDEPDTSNAQKNDGSITEDTTEDTTEDNDQSSSDEGIMTIPSLGPDDMDSNTNTPSNPGTGEDNNNNTNDNNNNNNGNTSDNTQTSTGGTVSAEEDNGIVIQGGFTKEQNRLLQCYSLMDNDKSTYINRALFNSKATAHNIMIACMIPTANQLADMDTSYEKVERNIINAVSKILWANGISVENLWREFDLNRAPSPALFLERDIWKKLLTEIDKQVEWRNEKFGIVTSKYTKYIAVIPDQTISTSSGSGSGGSPGSSSPGGSVDIGGISDTAQAVWTFFTGIGFTKECTAGIMGNLQQESGMDPTRYQSGGGQGRGICQWSNGEERFEGLKAHAASKGKEWTDLQCQLEFLDMELQGKDLTTLNYLKKYVGGYEQFKAMTNVREACQVFEDSFERAGKPMMERRFKYAEEFYNQFKDLSSSSSDTSDTETASYTLTRTIQPRTVSLDKMLLIGDSLTVGIESTVKEKYPNANAKGKVGKWAKHWLDDLDSLPANDAVSCVVQWLGINGVGNNESNLADSQKLLTKLKEMYPDKPIYCMKIFPTTKNGYNSHTGEWWKEASQEFNNGMATWCSSNGVTHIDATQGFIQDDGYLVPSKSVDGIHFTSEGYKEVLANIETAIGSGTSSGSGGSSGSSGSSGGGGGSTVSFTLTNSLIGDIENPGPAKDLPYTGNSMGGLGHDSWGGRMDYYIADPTNESAEKPAFNTVITNDEYQAFCDLYFTDERYLPDGTFETKTSFNNFWELMDNFCNEIEPYDKGLVESKDAGITQNERLNALTTTFTTDNENIVRFNVIESGPGSSDHCVKAAQELNMIVTPVDLKCEPIYPDLVIPPQYNTADLDTQSENTIPLTMIQSILDEDKDLSKIKLSFDYELLKDKKKTTAKHLGPINFLDPYPVDDKIEELENHYPKVFIDEIESQIYSCNHPGCPIAQPMAKNFAMLQDAIMNQSKRTEQRLVRLENILSTFMRNQMRLGSRVNINCMYYGGQCPGHNKYNCIRCLHDDRINDELVTIDQCLNCTRYEPILGQVYKILDDTGMNGSIILDDMQMSYSTLVDYQNLNKQINRSTQYPFCDVNASGLGIKPEKTMRETWKEANKELYLAENKDDPLFIDTDDEDIKAAQETKYIFRMDWNETFLNQQQPDTKPYSNENLVKRYRKEEGDLSYEDEISLLDPELDKDTIEDLQRASLLARGRWVNTLEVADTVQSNKYSSEKFYFDGFAEIGTGAQYYPGGGSGSSGGSYGSSGIGADCRNKIVEMAKQILADCEAGKAWYSQPYRTVDYSKPVKMPDGRTGYDCSSFASCCYLNAGLKSMYSKTCSGGTLMDEIVNNGGQMWLCNDEGISNALPGDLIVSGSGTMDASKMPYKASISHVMVYIGDGKVIHARGSSYGIQETTLSDYYKKGKHAFVRPKDLIEADAVAAQNSGGGFDESAGTVDNKNYVAKFLQAVVTCYNETGAGASGMGCEFNKTVASHSMPYGTKIYIPELAGQCGDGVYTVTDTGGPLFDIDVCTSAQIGKTNKDVYILEWGTGSVAKGYQYFIDYYLNNGKWDTYKAAWNKYKEMGGKLINFTKFTQEDANIKNHPNYNDK